MSKKIDRGINPHDGSRRRLKSVAHDSRKKYKRQIEKHIEGLEEISDLIKKFWYEEE